MLKNDEMKIPCDFLTAMKYIQESDERFVLKDYNSLIRNKRIPIVTVDKEGNRQVTFNLTPAIYAIDETSETPYVPMNQILGEYWYPAFYDGTGTAVFRRE